MLVVHQSTLSAWMSLTFLVLTTVTPNVIVSVSGGFPLYYTYLWSYLSGNATLSMTFSSATLGITYGISAGTYNVSMNVWGLIDNVP